MKELSEAGKKELALAIILWKDFKSEGKMNIEVTKIALEFTKHLGIEKEFSDLISKIPPMKIIERHP